MLKNVGQCRSTLCLLFGMLVGCTSTPGPAIVSVFPHEPYYSDKITVNIDSFASDGSGGQLTDKNSQYEYLWTRDGEVLPLTTSEMPSDETLAGQSWRVMVTPIGSPLDGPPSVVDFSINNPPTVTLELESTHIRGMALTAVAIQDDQEGDAVENEVTWSYIGEDGTEVTWEDASIDEVNDLTLPAAELGDVDREWTLKVIPYTPVLDSEGFQKEGARGEEVYAAVTIVNDAPVVTNVVLGPQGALVGSELLVEVFAANNDGDPLVYDYTWIADGFEVRSELGTIVPTDTLAANTLVKGQEVTVEVSVSDSYDSVVQTSNALMIENTPPVIAGVGLVWTDALTADSVIDCVPEGLADADGDDVYAQYVWTIDDGKGNLTVSSSTGSTLVGEFVRGDIVMCTVSPDDLVDVGTSKSASAEIGNGKPSIDAVVISPEPAYVSDTLSCTATGQSDPDDGDEITTSVRWEVKGTEQGVTSTLSGVFVKGDDVSCSMTPSDITEEGDAVSYSLIIADSAPSVTNVDISPSAPTVDDSLLCTYTFTDADGDADDSTISWTINGVSAGSSADLASGFSSGDVVQCTVSSNDGTNAGSSESLTVTIGNSPPTVSDLSITPDPAISSDSLYCSYTWDDLDDDFDQSEITWSVNGTAVGSSATLSSGFVRGDDVECTVASFDGSDAGNEESLTLVISNQLPGVSGVTVSPTAPAVGDTIDCSYSYSDSDGDADASTISWTIGGVEVGTGATLSSGFAKADEVECTVTANDGTDDGDSGSDTVTVVNTLAVASNVSVTPATPLVTDGLSCTYHYVDADGDSDASVISWWVNGVEAVSGASLSAGYVKGDSVECRIVPNDGDGYGITVLDTVVIGNSIPSATGLVLDPDPVMSGDDASCSYAFVDDDAADINQSIVRLTVGGMATTFTQVEQGRGHACSLSTDGKIRCWGDDSVGQISDVPSGNYIDLTAVADLGGCAVDDAGGLACWGDDTAPVISNVPTTGVYLSVSSGGEHACALVDDGSVLCWGDDSEGQTSAPQDLTDVVSISTGGWHSCAVDSSGAVHCWGIDSGGLDDEGQVGSAPTGSTFAAVASSGNHSCALDSAGLATCWGSDTYGQVGVVWQDYPGVYSGLATGMWHSCSLSTSGDIQCWGIDDGGADDFGQVSDAPTSGSYLSLGYAYSHAQCAIRDDQAVVCWGEDYLGDEVVNSVVRGEVVNCEVTPYDGDDTGQMVSVSGIVNNGVPSCLNVTISSDITPANTNATLSCDAVCSDPDRDTVTPLCGWSINGADAGVTDCSFAGTYISGDEVVCSVSGDDGTGSGAWSNSSILTITNAPPVVQNVTMTPSNPTSLDYVSCSSSSVDPDGDTVDSCLEELYIDGMIGSGGGGGGPFARGTSLYCQASCADEHGAASVPVQSTQVAVANSPAEITNVTVQPSTFSVGDDISCDYDYYDQDGDTDQSEISWTVNGSAAGYTEVRVGNIFACARAADGSFDCWGDYTNNGFSVPAGLEEWGLGYNFGCGLTAGGAPSCWGETSSWTQDIDSTQQFVELGMSAQAHHVCGLTATGEIDCWGQCTGCPKVFTNVPSDSGFTDVAVSADAACALGADGIPVCWGKLTSSVNLETPTTIVMTKLAGGDATMCGEMASTGGLTCWGEQQMTVTNSPPSNGPFSEIALGTNHGCALREADGLVSCWGEEVYEGAVTDVPSASLRSIGVGYDLSCGVDVQGHVTCWGIENGDGFSVVYADEMPEWSYTTTDEIACEVTGFDGASFTTVESSPGVYPSSLPSVSNVSISPDPAVSGELLTCNYTFQDQQGDADQSTVEWLDDTTAILSTGATFIAPPYLASAPNTYSCRVTPFDGVDTGVPVSSSVITIGDGPLIIDSLSISPDPAAHTDLLSCQVTAHDPDDLSHSPHIVYDWSVNGSSVSQVFTDLALTPYGGCVIASVDGEPHCWGSSVLVSGAPTSRLKSVDGADFYFCGIDVYDKLECFGTPPEDDGSSPYRPEPTVELKQVATSSNTACGIMMNDELTCWGSDFYSGLGYDEWQSIFDGMPSGTFRKVVASEDSMCAISMAGALECWGYSSYTWLFPITPAETMDVTGTEWVDVAMGDGYACAITDTYKLFCEGDQTYDTNIVHILAANYTGNYTKVSANRFTACLLGLNGTIDCLGEASMENQAPNGSDWVMIDLPPWANYACAIDDTSTMECWGNLSNGGGYPNVGQVIDVDSMILGDLNIGYMDEIGTLGAGFEPGDTVECSVTVYDHVAVGVVDSVSETINELPTVSSVSVTPDPVYQGANDFECTYSGYSDPEGGADQSVFDWYLNGDFQQSGGTFSASVIRDDVIECILSVSDGIASAPQIIVSDEVVNTAPAVSGVEVMDWNGDQLCQYAYTDVEGDTDKSGVLWEVDGEILRPFTTMALSDYYACATDYHGEITCWGSGPTPPQGHFFLGNTTTYQDLSVKSSDGCALDQNGRVECWDDADLMNDAPIGAGHTDIDCTRGYTGACCAVDVSGSIDCWGSSSYNIVSAAPVGSGYQAITVGTYEACALNSVNQVECWGGSGSPPTLNDLAPTTMFTQIEVGDDFGCGVTISGGIECWGESVPPISGAGVYTQVSVSSSWPMACGLDDTGLIECWSDTNYIGDLPVWLDAMNNSTSLYSEVHAGDYYGSCALDVNGMIHCWGNEEATNSAGMYLPDTRPHQSVSGLLLFQMMNGGESVRCGVFPDDGFDIGVEEWSAPYTVP